MMPVVETVPAAFASTAHRHRPVTAVREQGRATSWLRLAQDVRLLAVGLHADGAGGAGRRIAVGGADGADRVALELAVMAAGAAAVIDASEADVAIDATALQAIRAAGQERDAAEPDAFERISRAVAADDVAIVAGGTPFTHGNVLTGARSLVQALDIDAGDVVRCSLPLDDAAGWGVARGATLLTAATLLVGRGAATIVVSDDRHDLPAAQPARGRFRRRVTDGGPRHVLVLKHNAWSFAGVAGLVTGPGGPLPGVTVGIDDDGTVLVRSDAVPRSRCEGGWLRTGWRGDLVDGVLVST